MRSTARLPLIVAALALGVATAALSGCGSGAASSAASSAADQATGAVSSAAAGITSKTQSAPATAGAQTVTKTATQPAATTSVTNSVSVNAQATHTTPAPTDSGGGLPWWGWVLIGLGAAGVLVAVFAAGQRRRGQQSGAGSPPAPDAPR